MLQNLPGVDAVGAQVRPGVWLVEDAVQRLPVGHGVRVAVGAGVRRVVRQRRRVVEQRQRVAHQPSKRQPVELLVVGVELVGGVGAERPRQRRRPRKTLTNRWIGTWVGTSLWRPLNS